MPALCDRQRILRPAGGAGESHRTAVITGERFEVLAGYQ